MKAHLLTLSLAMGLAAQLAAQRTASSEWPAYGGDPGGHRFAALDQITRTNVGSLRLAWVYRTGDLMNARGRFEATPLLVDGILYVSTPLGRVVALDPATGAERWTFDARVDLTGDYGDLANRGVATWLDTRSASGATCRRRIYLGTVDARLIAVDAATGLPCVDFGTRGTIDLTHSCRWSGWTGWSRAGTMWCCALAARPTACGPRSTAWRSGSIRAASCASAARRL